MNQEIFESLKKVALEGSATLMKRGSSLMPTFILHLSQSNEIEIIGCPVNFGSRQIKGRIAEMIKARAQEQNVDIIAFACEAWTVEREGGPESIPSGSLEKEPDRQEVIMVLIEARGIKRNLWRARITRDETEKVTDIGEWEEYTKGVAEMSGTFVGLIPELN